MTGPGSRSTSWRSPWVIGGSVCALFALVLLAPKLIEQWLGCPSCFHWTYRSAFVPVIWSLPLVAICALAGFGGPFLERHPLARGLLTIAGGIVTAFLSYWIHFRLYRDEASGEQFPEFLSPRVIWLWSCVALWMLGRQHAHRRWALTAGPPILLLGFWYKFSGVDSEHFHNRVESWIRQLVDLTRTSFPLAAAGMSVALIILALCRIYDRRTGWIRILGITTGVAAFAWLILGPTEPAWKPLPLVDDIDGPPIEALCRDVNGGVVALSGPWRGGSDHLLSEWRSGDRSWRPMAPARGTVEFTTGIDAGRPASKRCEIHWTERQTALRALFFLPPAQRSVTLILPSPGMIEPARVALFPRGFMSSDQPQAECRAIILGERGERPLQSDTLLYRWLSTHSALTICPEPFKLHEYGGRLFAFISPARGPGNLYEFDELNQTGLLLHSQVPPVQWLPSGVLVVRTLNIDEQFHQQLIERDFISRTYAVLLDRTLSEPRYADTPEKCQRLFPLEEQPARFDRLEGLYPGGYIKIPSVLTVPQASGDPECGWGKPFVRDRFFKPPPIR